MVLRRRSDKPAESRLSRAEWEWVVAIIVVNGAVCTALVYVVWW